MVKLFYTTLTHQCRPSLFGNISCRAKVCNFLQGWYIVELYVFLSDENDNPPVFTENPYDFQVHEDVAVGSSVGTITALDQDMNNAGTLRQDSIP